MAKKTLKSRKLTTTNPRRQQTTFRVIRFLLFTILIITLLAVVYRIYLWRVNYMDPANVYGEWIEIGAPIYNTEVLDFRPQGVYRNNRLVSTTYSFNGKQITIITGNGEVTYEFAGTDSSPQIKRTGTNAPPQRFIKKGYEDTVKQTSSGTGSEARRAALAEHFK